MSFVTTFGKDTKTKRLKQILLHLPSPLYYGCEEGICSLLDMTFRKLMGGMP